MEDRQCGESVKGYTFEAVTGCRVRAMSAADLAVEKRAMAHLGTVHALPAAVWSARQACGTRACAGLVADLGVAGPALAAS